jgi:hypothetical protein
MSKLESNVSNAAGPLKGGESPIKELNKCESKSSLKGRLSELEYLLLSSGKITKYLFKPSDIDHFYKSTRMKADLVNFF